MCGVVGVGGGGGGGGEAEWWWGVQIFVSTWLLKIANSRRQLLFASALKYCPQSLQIACASLCKFSIPNPLVHGGLSLLGVWSVISWSCW